jgi:hypothetical protein
MRPLGPLSAAAFLVLAGCAPPVDVATGVTGQFGEASRLMILQAADGPVPLSIDEPPATSGGAVSEADLVAAADGAISWSSSRFMASSPTGQDFAVLLRFARVPTNPRDECAGGPSRPAPPSPFGAGGLHVHAIACSDGLPVADVLGNTEETTPDAAKQLVRSTIDRLLPGSGSGGGWGFPGVRLGVGIGSGGSSGIGVGVGF